jgi:hypothetical protein
MVQHSNILNGSHYGVMIVIDDYTWIESVKRGNFRLHPWANIRRRRCITLPHDSDFAMLRNALLRSQRIDVPCMRKLQAYGTIEVISNGKHALSLFIKIVLFAVVALFVAEMVPYDGLVNSITGFSISSADKFTRFILGEPDLEVWESLDGYFSILINTLISVLPRAPLPRRTVARHTVSPAGIPREWFSSTLRRLAKIFGFTFLFWALFRLLPYQSFIPGSNVFKFHIGGDCGLSVALNDCLLLVHHEENHN